MLLIYLSSLDVRPTSGTVYSVRTHGISGWYGLVVVICASLYFVCLHIVYMRAEKMGNKHIITLVKVEYGWILYEWACVFSRAKGK